MKHPSAFSFAIALVLLANVLWYRMKVLLRRNGYEVSWFYHHWQDLPNFTRLIARTEDPGARRHYRMIFMAFLFTVLVLVLLVLNGGLRAA